MFFTTGVGEGGVTIAQARYSLQTPLKRYATDKYDKHDICILLFSPPTVQRRCC